MGASLADNYDRGIRIWCTFMVWQLDHWLRLQCNTNQIYNARKVTPKCESEVRVYYSICHTFMPLHLLKSSYIEKSHEGNACTIVHISYCSSEFLS